MLSTLCAIIVSFIGIYFTAIATSIVSRLARSQHHRLLPELNQCPILHAVSSLVCLSTGTGHTNIHTCRTGLAVGQGPPARCPGRRTWSTTTNSNDSSL
ncbi:hypothetical protein EDB19DRAFT_1819851, partial [Suillus lakei]